MIRTIPLFLMPMAVLPPFGALLTPAPVAAAQLRPETVQAFEQHVRAAYRQGTPQGRFLWANASEDRRQRLREGELVIQPRQGKGDIAVEKGIIHHWIGGVFVPGRGAAAALALLRDFDAYKQVYPASVEDSRTIERHGNTSKAYLRLRTHRIVTVVLNTEYDIEFTRLDAHRWQSRSVSTRIAQVTDPGEPEERELPVGEDSGYLWRIVTLWRFEEADGGVYLECEVLGLTRGVPFGLGWLIRPIIRSFPRESLAETLMDTRDALLRDCQEAAPPRALSRNGAQNSPRPARPGVLKASLP
jgi:hypothetical protein